MRALAWCLALLLSPLPAVAQATPDTLPLDWRVRDLSGREVRLDAYRGRPIFLNLWATWCTPCVAELASIVGLRDSLDARGQQDVVFLLVSPETRKQVERFTKRRPYPLPFAVELDPLPRELRFRAVPTTWLVSRSGAIAHVQRGAVAWDSPLFVQFVSLTLQ